MANLRALYSYMWAHPGKKLLFMGGEIGQFGEWSEERQIEWERLDGSTRDQVQRQFALRERCSVRCSCR